MDQKKTGRFLKTLRNEKNMTQEQLAAHFNVSSRSVSRWETGANLPDISLLAEIADFYGVDVREIIDGERKSDVMNKEVREVADKMADYARNEKSSLLGMIQAVSITGVCILFLALLFELKGLQDNTMGIMPVILTFAGLLIMAFITLYVTGILSKLVKNKGFMITIIVITSVLAAVAAYFIFMTLIVGGLLFFDMFMSKIKVETDPATYHQYIHGDKDKGEAGWGTAELFDVLPRDLDGLDVTEYQLTYYNPWDAQYVVYMTVKYDDAQFEAESSRLRDIGIEDYKGIYTVTDEPDGYDLVAMMCDDYSGFVYAMVPEEGWDGRSITYVGIYFCNWHLDLDIHDYIPDEYLLEGFDASMGNPWESQIEESLEDALPDQEK